MIVKLARAKNISHPLETHGLNSHLTSVECAKEGAKSKTEPAVELFSKKEVWRGQPPRKKVENNSSADLSAVARSAKVEGRRKRWQVKEITRFWAI